MQLSNEVIKNKRIVRSQKFVVQYCVDQNEFFSQI